jgi:hypothetical protein
MDQIGTIHQQGRTVYFVLPGENEAYRIHEADFRTFLTQRAEKGCKAASLEEALRRLGV